MPATDTAGACLCRSLPAGDFSWLCGSLPAVIFVTAYPDAGFKAFTGIGLREVVQLMRKQTWLRRDTVLWERAILWERACLR